MCHPKNKLTLWEIEILQLACQRVGQDPEVLGKYFASAKAKLRAQQKELIARYTEESVDNDRETDLN